MADEKDTDASAKAESEKSEKPSLTSLLEDWEKGASKDAPKKADKSDAKSGSDSSDRVAALEYRLEMKELIPQVKGELDVPDKFVETYINMRASDDRRLSQIFDERFENRSAWEKAVEQLGDEFKSFAEKTGIKSPKEEPKKSSPKRDDRGLAAAAHMARESKPSGDGFESIDWGSLSNQEFAMKKSAYFRALKAGQES